MLGLRFCARALTAELRNLQSFPDRSPSLAEIMGGRMIHRRIAVSGLGWRMGQSLWGDSLGLPEPGDSGCLVATAAGRPLSRAE